MSKVVEDHQVGQQRGELHVLLLLRWVVGRHGAVLADRTQSQKPLNASACWSRPSPGSAAGRSAVDLMVAWTSLSAPARRAFRAALPADEATWERGRGWALLHGLRCAAYSAGSPLLGDIGRYTVSQVIPASGAR